MSEEMINDTFDGTPVAPTVASTHLLETHDVTVKYNYTKEALHRTSLAFDAGRSEEHTSELQSQR